MAEVFVSGSTSNPAFALGCLGLMGVANLMGKHTAGRFGLEKGGFSWEVAGDHEEIIAALGRVTYEKFQPISAGSASAPYPLVLRLPDIQEPLVLDWWIDWARQEKNAWGLWAGRVSPNSIKDKLVVGMKAGQPRVEDLFTATAEVDSGSLFGLDARFTWSAISLGFSINDLPNAKVVIWPWAELLAAIGMQVLSPPGNRRKMRPFRYTVWHGSNLPLPLARLVMLGETWLGLGATTTYSAHVLRNGSLRKFGEGRPWQPGQDEEADGAGRESDEEEDGGGISDDA